MTGNDLQQFLNTLGVTPGLLNLSVRVRGRGIITSAAVVGSSATLCTGDCIADPYILLIGEKE